MEWDTNYKSGSTLVKQLTKQLSISDFAPGHIESMPSVIHIRTALHVLLRVNMVLFTKPKVHRILHCQQMRCETTYTEGDRRANAAVFKLGSADQRGSARGFRKVVIVCTVFNNLRLICFQICTRKSVTQSHCIAWKCCRGLAWQAFCWCLLVVLRVICWLLWWLVHPFCGRWCYG